MVAPAALALLYPSLLTALMQANYTIYPDGDGVPHLIKLDDTPLTTQQLETLATDLSTVTFTLYTRNNPKNGQLLSMKDPTSISNSNFKSNRPTIFVTHGWRSGGNKPVCTLIRDAYLQVLDCNVIVVDWSIISENVTYYFPAKSVPTVAQYVGTFINYMRSLVQLNTFTTKLVGHSLGAHLMSLTGKFVSKYGLVSEVIALDPAKPLFDNNGPNDRVDRSHGQNVQVIHTSSLGFQKAIGNSDFFANDASTQPGCDSKYMKIRSPWGSTECSHSRAYEYFSESLKKPKGFVGQSKDGKKAYMGGPNLDRNAKGTYYFKTASHPPYALGG